MSNSFERLNEWVRTSVTIRMLSVAILVLLLLIPASMIESLVRERSGRQARVIEEISRTWSGAQTVAGPVLSIPYVTYDRTADDRTVTTKRWAHFLPTTHDVEVQLDPETRRRALYEAVVYRADLRFRGSFAAPDFAALNIDPATVRLPEAVVTVGLTDMRGIEEEIELGWNDEGLRFDAGLDVRQVLPEGVSTRVPITPGDTAYLYAFDLKLRGSQALDFVPVGRETNVSVRSVWATPSFVGAFLPEVRTVSDSGFTARWRVLHLNRTYPQQWRGEAYRLVGGGVRPRYRTDVEGMAEPTASGGGGGATFGVNLLLPVDPYQKTTRVAKYAVMLIALTFVTFFFVEIMTRRNIHPIQYILVGLALCVFYTLLLSLAEQIGFDGAYLVAMGATVGLITAYVGGVFRSPRLTALMAGILLVLYGFIWVVLQLEDYALLLGSVALFVLLAVLMYLTRRIDWYRFGKQHGRPEA
ncbi:MAG: cell envelope integrity protein CreD [Catalinimonas sp.]